MDNNSNGYEPNNRGVAVKLGAIIAAVVIFFGIVAGLAFVAIKNLINGAVKQDTSIYNVSVTAVISENREHEKVTEDSRSIVYTPVYQYEYNGRTYNVEGSVSSNIIKYKVGEKVEVKISEGDPGKMYDPEYNRNKVFKDIEHEFSIFWLVIIIVPLAVVAIAVIAVCAAMKKRSQNNVYITNVSDEDAEDPNDDYR
ncbi:DUF3592 domain-containing protein [Ruminococcus flavefaciens]|uniref:DUF3592 domain-containing protein n=1 Tax=Ruminococcus flavefaciens TaxID=1265 RepID=A0A1M7IMZ4_RUMFL|nr:DUF3592 domain-containing protein [Ruminococcus flavefaciens]SHM42049.1 Protein of unknown function [Ruminococcus flavefaciens]